ncbi:MAG: hydrogenase nickel incorporation protein HypB [Candidatus Eremiobacterota bacterium]
MIVPVMADIMNANNLIAEQNRKYFDGKSIYVVNLLASPGAGKTTFLEETIRRINNNIPVAVIEGDLASDVDALRIEKFGVQVVQINTGKGCHLNAAMIQKSFDNLSLEKIHVLFIENVGNLVCPAGYKLGENVTVLLTSTTEGDDKILKYPPVFQMSDLLILNKIDLLPYVDYNLESLKKEFHKINPKARLLSLSSKTGEAFEDWIDWLKNEIFIFRGKT